MDRDLETFLVVLYVIVDDLYQRDIAPRMPACGGPPAQMSAVLIKEKRTQSEATREPFS